MELALIQDSMQLGSKLCGPDAFSACGRKVGEARLSKGRETQGRELVNKGWCNLPGLSGRNGQISYLQLHLLPEGKPHRPVPYGRRLLRKPHSAGSCWECIGQPVSEEVQAGQGVG